MKLKKFIFIKPKSRDEVMLVIAESDGHYTCFNNDIVELAKNQINIVSQKDEVGELSHYELLIYVKSIHCQMDAYESFFNNGDNTKVKKSFL